MKITAPSGIVGYKPEGFAHAPIITHSIIPANRADFDFWNIIVRPQTADQQERMNEWSQAIRAEFCGKPVEDVILVKKFYL